MKTLEGMQEAIPHFDPEMAEAERKEEERTGKKTGMTLRRLLIQQVCAPKAKDEDESQIVWQLGLKLRGCESNTCDVEEAEFKILRTRVKENSLGWPGYTQGWVSLRLDEIEKQAKEKKKELTLVQPES